MLHHGAFRDEGEVFIKDVWGSFLDRLAEWLDGSLRLFGPVDRSKEQRFQHFPVSASSRLSFQSGPEIPGGTLIPFARSLRGLDAAMIFLPTLRGLAAAVLCRLAGTPFVVYSGLGATDWNAPGTATRARATLYRVLERVALGTASGAIVAGAELEERFGRRMPTFRTAPVTGVVAEGDPRIPKKRVVLYVGSLSERKGVPELLRAWESLRTGVRRGWELRIAGTGPLTEEVERFAAARDDCSALGYVPHGPELFREYAEAAIVVLPSRNEGFPRVLLEAAAYGCGLTATRVGGVAAAFGVGFEPRWIEPGSERSIATALEGMIEGDWRSAGVGARRWFHGTFAERDRALEAGAFLVTQIPRLSR
jgi:glycosyltransferase involved in cell wall biosynthesis